MPRLFARSTACLRHCRVREHAITRQFELNSRIRLSVFSAHLLDMRDWASTTALYEAVSTFGREWGTCMGHVIPTARVVPGAWGRAGDIAPRLAFRSPLSFRRESKVHTARVSAHHRQTP